MVVPTHATDGRATARAGGSAAPPAAPGSRWQSPPAAGWHGKATAAVAGGAFGNTPTVSPRPQRPQPSGAPRSASRLRSRSMNSVPAAATSQLQQRPVPHVGLETNRAWRHTRAAPGCRATRHGWPPAAGPGRWPFADRGGCPAPQHAARHQGDAAAWPAASSAGQLGHQRHATRQDERSRAGATGTQQAAHVARGVGASKAGSLATSALTHPGRAMPVIRSRTACRAPGCAAPPAPPPRFAPDRTRTGRPRPLDQAAGAGGQRAQGVAEHAHWLAGHTSGRAPGPGRRRRPTSGQAQQQLRPVPPGWPRRRAGLLGIGSHRRSGRTPEHRACRRPAFVAAASRSAPGAGGARRMAAVKKPMSTSVRCSD